MGAYSGFKLYHYFNACACALYDILHSASLWSASNISGNIHQNENRFLAFGSQISNTEVENAMISDCIIDCIKFNGIKLLCFFFCSVYLALVFLSTILFKVAKLQFFSLAPFCQI